MTNRDQLILDHLPQVELLARKLHRRCPQVELDDLISAGTIGLICAVDRFDPARNCKLKTLAEHRIRGAMLDYLRQLDPLPRAVRQFQKRRDAVNTPTENPTPDELAAILGLPTRKVIQWSRMVRASKTIPFETLPESVRRKVA
jgi:RNA polymerase sigma factor for flagellar operon FliA